MIQYYCPILGHKYTIQGDYSQGLIMTEHQRLQVKMAANGCISGTLDEWPNLFVTMKNLGADVKGSTTAYEAKLLCQQLLMNEEQHEVEREEKQSEDSYPKPSEEGEEQ